MSIVNQAAEFLFMDRQNRFTHADLVIYHPGHYGELNRQIIELYHQERFSAITLSGAPNSFMEGKSEYEAHAPVLVEGGIPSEAIIHVKQGTTIEEIIRHSFEIPRALGIPYQKVLLVGKSFFTRRMYMLGERYAPEGTILDVLGLVDDRGITKENWLHTQKGRERVLGEWNKIGKLLQEQVDG